MATRELTGVLVRMPGALKRALVNEVRRRDSNMNDVAVGILAERFSTSFSPSGRRGTPGGESGTVLLRLPPQLKRRLQEVAFESESNMNELIVQTLANEVGVDLEDARGGRSVPFGGNTQQMGTNDSKNGPWSTLSSKVISD